MNAAGPWWRGGRGEWYVVVQIGLLVLLALGPPSLAGWPKWSPAIAPLCRALGVALAILGVLLLLGGGLRLGAHLTPLPYPKNGGPLRETGAYRLVRHPMYGGGILVAVGWALWRQGWLTLAYAGILLVFLSVKIRREERWLIEKHPGYADYRRRVRKLIPFIY